MKNLKTLIVLLAGLITLNSGAVTTNSISGMVVNNTDLETTELKVTLHWTCGAWGGVSKEGLVSTYVNADGSYNLESKETGLCPSLLFDFNQNTTISYKGNKLLLSGIKNNQTLRILSLSEETVKLPQNFSSRKVNVLIYQQHEEDRLNSYPKSSLLKNYKLNLEGDIFTFPQTYIAVALMNEEEMNRISLKINIVDKLNRTILSTNERMDSGADDAFINTVINFK